MLTPREVAANRYLAVGGQPTTVVGFKEADYEVMREHRAERLRVALRALRAAKGTSRIVPGEWSDDELEQAAQHVERLIEDGDTRPGPAVAVPRTTAL